MIAVALVVFTSPALAYPSPIQIQVNGQPPDEGYFAILVDDVLMIPVEVLVQVLGAKISYDSDAGVVNITLASDSLDVNRTTDSQETAFNPDTEASTEGTLVYIAKSGSKYHREGCRYLSTGGSAITLDDAKRSGYEPCKVCNPPH